MAGYCGAVWTGFGRPDERCDVLLELAPLSLYCCCWNICSCNSPGMLVLNSKPSMVLSICPLTDYIHGSQMKTLGFVVVLQSISVTFRSLCPFTVQVSSHSMLLRCIILYIFSLLLLKVVLRPFLSEETHLQIVSVDWVWMRNTVWT